MPTGGIFLPRMIPAESSLDTLNCSFGNLLLFVLFFVFLFFAIIVYSLLLLGKQELVAGCFSLHKPKAKQQI